MLLVPLVLVAAEPAHACHNETAMALARAARRSSPEEQARQAAEDEARRVEEAERARLAALRERRRAEEEERRRAVAAQLAAERALAESRQRKGLLGVTIGLAGAIACGGFTVLQLVSQYTATLPPDRRRAWIA